MVCFASIIIFQDNLSPFGVLFFNQGNFPFALPFFESFLSRYGIRDKVIAFEPYEACNIVGCRKTRGVVMGFVLFEPNRKVACYAYIKRPILLRAQNIHITIAHKMTLAIWITRSSRVMTEIGYVELNVVITRLDRVIHMV